MGRQLVAGGKGDFPYEDGRHLLVVIRHWVLVDDSGTHRGSRYCLIAGYRTTPKTWASINLKWRKVLADYHVPVFHSNVFFNRKRISSNPKKNPYVGWSDKKANNFLGDLLKIVSEQRKLIRLVSAVKVADFERYSYAERCALAGHVPTPARRQSRDPVAFHLVFRLMLNIAASTSTPDTQLHFIVADQEEYRQRAHDSYTLTKHLGEGGWEHKLKGIEFQEPVDQPGLQVADLLGWQWYNYWNRRAAGQAISRQNVSTMNILNKKPGNVLIWNRSDMEAWIDLCATPDDREFLQRITPDDRDALEEAQRLWQRSLRELQPRDP